MDSPRQGTAWTWILAGIAGSTYALLFAILETVNEEPAEATHSISVWHYPVIWVLAMTFFLLVFAAVRTVRSRKVREHAVWFGLNVAAALLLALYWVFPMVSTLVRCLGTIDC